jgi:cell division protein FtsI (penicillin-binding protein 3)
VTVATMGIPAPRLPAWRARFLFTVILLWFAVLGARAFYLQGMSTGFLQAKGELRYSRTIELSATRGMIVDRHNEPLAISTPVESVAASPADLEVTPEQMQELSRLLNVSVSEMSKKIEDREREFVYLKRLLPPEQA